MTDIISPKRSEILNEQGQPTQRLLIYLEELARIINELEKRIIALEP